MKATKVWSREDVNDDISTYKKIMSLERVRHVQRVQRGQSFGFFTGDRIRLLLNINPRSQVQRFIFKNNNNMDISNTAVDYYNIKITLCNNSAENPRW
jgi:hypothetical protein